jgi:hypothetical protein
MLKPTLDYRRSPDETASAEKRYACGRLLIFVAIGWTNLAGSRPARFAEETLTPNPSINPSLTNRAMRSG